MRAVVVDIKGKYAVVLDKQGRFIKVRNDRQFRVGYEVDVSYGEAFGFNALARIASIAAVLLFTLTLSYGVYSYSVPYSYINVDINPSVEITANIYERIIDVEGLNEEGRKLLSTGKYRNRKLQDGVENILESAVKEGYLKADSLNTVMFTVSGKDEERFDEIEKQIEGTASQEFEAAGVETEIVVEKIALERRDRAKAMGISPGKLNLIERLIEVRPELGVEELKDAPVKEIMELIKQSRKNNKAEVKAKKKQEQESENEKGSPALNDKGINPEKSEKDKKFEEEKVNKSGKNETGNKPENRGVIKGNKDKSPQSGHEDKTDNSSKKDDPDKEEKTAGNPGKSEDGNDSDDDPDEDSDDDPDEDGGPDDKDKSSNEGKDKGKGESSSGKGIDIR